MTLQRITEDIAPLLASYAARTVGVLVFLVVVWVLASWLRGAIRKSARRAELDETLVRFLANSVRWLLLLAAGVACLGVFGVQTASFAAVLGAAGLAIGLAMQGSLSNVAAGVMLLVLRPFKVGDYVRAGGEMGTVDEIDLLVTRLDTPDNRRIILPNSKVFSDAIENFSFHPVRRVDVLVGTVYDADIEKTRAVLERALADVPGQVPDREAAVFLVALGDSSISWAVRAWAKKDDFFTMQQALTTAIKRRLDDAGIGIPFPQLEVHLDKGLVAELQSDKAA